MRIIVDAMSGDFAPQAILEGVLAASKKCHYTFVLAGREDKVLPFLQDHGADMSRFEFIEAQDVISMDDDPVMAIRRKKDASMVRGLQCLAGGGGDAFVCAGNTGALFAGATLIVGRAEGIKRAAIGTIMPGEKPCMLLDAGANATVKPEYLEQFAIIGASYMNKMFDIEFPSVGILNIGTEEHKGTDLQIEAAALLKANPDINYKGYVEANYVMRGFCDVVVCDGFSGNVYLKAVEGVGRRVSDLMRDVYSHGFAAKLSYLAVRDRISRMKALFDASEYGGSPILGIKKPVIKAHGSSDARAIANAIYQAIRFSQSDFMQNVI